MFKNEMLEIMSLAYDISNNKSTDVFVSYSPHCNLINVSIYYAGWVRDTYPDFNVNVYCDVNKYTTEEMVMDTFTEIKSKLTYLLETNEFESTEVVANNE